MLNPIRASLCVALACLCMACGARSPNPQYYVLTTPSANLADQASTRKQDTKKNTPNTILAIGPIILPGYLDRIAIVGRNTTPDLTIYATHLWSEPLNKGITQILANTINTTSQTISALPYNAPRTPELRLGISIIRFDGTPNNTCTLEAQWFLLDATGTTLKEGHFTQQSKASNSMQSMVETLASLMVQFGTDISQDIDMIKNTNIIPSKIAQ